MISLYVSTINSDMSNNGCATNFKTDCLDRRPRLSTGMKGINLDSMVNRCPTDIISPVTHNQTQGDQPQKAISRSKDNTRPNYRGVLAHTPHRFLAESLVLAYGMLLSLSAPIALMWISFAPTSFAATATSSAPCHCIVSNSLGRGGGTMQDPDERNNKIRVFERNRETPGVRYAGICTCSYTKHVHHLTLSGRSSLRPLNYLKEIVRILTT